jgi:hypothetical protein
MIACDEIKIGGLPGAIWTDDSVNISFDDFEAYLIDSPEFSKFFRYPLGLKKHTIFPLID